MRISRNKEARMRGIVAWWSEHGPGWATFHAHWVTAHEPRPWLPWEPPPAPSAALISGHGGAIAWNLLLGPRGTCPHGTCRHGTSLHGTGLNGPGPQGQTGTR
jgi:hypothetical protein